MSNSPWIRRIVFLIWMMALVCTVAANPHITKPELWAWGFNALVAMTIVSFLPVRDFLIRIPFIHKAGLITFYTAMVLVQHSAGVSSNHFEFTRSTFPFIPWDMFGTQPHVEKVEYYEFEGVDSGKGKRILNAGNLYQSLRHERIIAPMILNIMTDLQTHRSLEENGYLSNMLQVIGQRYNAIHHQNPIDRIDVMKCTMDFSESHNPPVMRENIGTFY